MTSALKRDRAADLLKGYACFLVLLSHVILGISKCGLVDVPRAFSVIEVAASMFHVPLFMFVSGFVYSFTGGWQRKKTRLGFILYKLLNLGVPYAFFSAVYIAMNSVIPSVNNKNQLGDILTIYKDPTAQYWFIYALFFIFIMYVILEAFIKNRFVLAAVFVAARIVLLLSGAELGFLQDAVLNAGYFALGAAVKKLDFISGENEMRTRRAALCGTAVAVHAAIALTAASFGAGNDIAKLALALLGIGGSAALVNLVLVSPRLTAAGLFAARYSFPIYLLHTIFTAGIRIMLLKLNITGFFIHFFAGLLIGFFMPVLAAFVCRKLGWAEFVFYPGAVIKRLKGRNGV